MTRARLAIIMTMPCIALSSCMVGPDFVHPSLPDTHAYTPAPQIHHTVSIPQAGKAGYAQHFIKNEDIPGLWWQVFRSPAVNKLICQAMANNPNLAAAEAALMAARQAYYAQIGGTLLPLVNANASYERQRFSYNSLGANGQLFGGGTRSNTFNLYNSTVNITYTLDVFGGLRRLIEAYGAQVEYQRFQLEGAYLTLSTNIVTTAITIASLREQIAATEELIRLQRDTLNIIHKQFELGGISKLDYLFQEAQVAQTEGTLPPLKQSLAKNNHLLSVLIGDLPSENHLPKFKLKDFTLATHIPIGIPAVLVRQRPDIRAAEALIHLYSAQIGVATANLIPQFTLYGNYGWQSSILSQLISPANIVWSWGGGIVETLFNGGALVAKRRQAVAAYQQFAAQYQQAVLQGFQNVADTLRALEHDAEGLKAQKEAEVAAQQSLKLTTDQYFLGGVNYLALLIAQRTYHQAQIARIRTEADRYTDTAALFQALGGGWWSRPSLENEPALQENVSQYLPPKTLI